MGLSITILIIILTVALSISAFRDAHLRYKLIFNPYACQHRGEWYRFLTSGFIHADYVHLGVNMFVFYMFGSQVEKYFKAYLPFGEVQYILMYCLTIVLANARTFYKYRDSQWYNALGASGGVAGIMFSYVAFEPFNLMYIYGIIPLPGIAMAVLYVVYSSYMSKRGGDNINHDAHLWGGIVGAAYTIIQLPELITRWF